MSPAAAVLAQPLVCSKLNEAPWGGQIRPENLAEQHALLPTATLTSDPIELDLKDIRAGSGLGRRTRAGRTVPRVSLHARVEERLERGHAWRRRTSPRADLPYDRALCVRGS
jgi:hypothetical protein